MKTVLAVDDDPLVRLTVCHYLHTCGWRALEAPSGGTALEMLKVQGEQIDAVVIDLGLPDMNGADLPLRAQPAGCSYVFMTGSLEVQSNLPGPLLTKPFDAKALESALELAWAQRAGSPRTCAGSRATTPLR